MKLVEIRQEGEYYLAYFVSHRKLLTLNSVGAEIVDRFFNKDQSEASILEVLSKEDKTITEKLINSFLSDVKEQILNSENEGYSFLKGQIPSAPVSVELQINTKCNFRCKHCFQEDYAMSMPFKTVKKYLKILKDTGVFEVHLVGGEVFLHPDFFSILDLCTEHNFAINIVTNGSFLNEENVKKLKKHPNLAVLVSLEGVGKVNDEIRGEGSFKKVDAAIRRLIKNGIYTEISNTLTARNVDLVKEILDYAEDLGIKCNLNLFKPFKDTHEGLVLPPEKYFEVGIDISKDKDSKSGLTNAAIMAKLLQGKKRDECRATLLGLSVDVNGKMIPCVSLKEADYYKEYVKLPDFGKDYLEDWANNEYFQEFRDIGFRECQARAYIFNGKPDKNDPYGILEFEKYMKRRLKDGG